MELESLGAFLKSRRDRTTPERIGLRTFGVTRRVPGLRREELAQLAGVSAGYYTRLEQDQAGTVSAQVIDALAQTGSTRSAMSGWVAAKPLSNVISRPWFERASAARYASVT